MKRSSQRVDCRSSLRPAVLLLVLTLNACNAPGVGVAENPPPAPTPAPETTWDQGDWDATNWN